MIMKRMTAIIMAVALLLNPVMVDAAQPSESATRNADYMTAKSANGTPNWFNGAYYSELYEDLKTVFGTNEKKLYTHSRIYGFAESRLVIPVLDVVKYREAYPDLEKAFGDNWNAYIRHYFEYGIEEGRENFTNFDVADYLNRYPDLLEAFGTDLVAATRHYIEFGYTEGRNGCRAISEIAIQQRNYTGDMRVDYEDGCYEIVTYVDGVITVSKYYMSDGSLHSISEYDANGYIVKDSIYNDADVLDVICIYENDVNGKPIKHSYYNGDGSLQEKRISEYDTNGYLVKESIYNGADVLEVISIFKNDANGNIIEKREYFSDGAYSVWEMDVTGEFVKKISIYFSDGTYIVREYDIYGECIQENYYDANGNEIPA